MEFGDECCKPYSSFLFILDLTVAVYKGAEMYLMFKLAGLCLLLLQTVPSLALVILFMFAVAQPDFSYTFGMER